MEVKFVGQGLDPANDYSAGQCFLESIQSKKYQSIKIFVAFLSTGGIRNIIEEVLDHKNQGGQIKFFVGVNLHGTSKEALETLLEHDIETSIVYSPNNIIYHPKIYVFEGRETNRALIGSANLTESGLFQNIEASVRLDFEQEDESGQEFMAEVYDHFNSVINHNHQSCQKLTPETLEILVGNKVVLPEALSRKKLNKINKEFAERDTKSYTKLQDLFGKISPNRPPKGYRKLSVKKEFSQDIDSGSVNIVDEEIEIPSGAMWIETGKLTGGSRNILDLSKKGKLNGDLKFGSVSFFGLNPEGIETSKEVDILFGGKMYKSNKIFYTASNNNWRFRINGETEDGEKITMYTKPTLGENGGFQDKILLFSLQNDTVYKLEVLEKEELSRLIENSTVWAKGGNGQGRAYGIA